MWQYLIPAAATAFSAFMSRAGGEEANEQNMALSQRQMDFQERMSNTSYQRQVDDLRAAGLNPMLGYMKGAGATSPMGSSAHMENVGEAAARGGAHGASSAIAAASIAKLEADAELARAQAKKVGTEESLLSPSVHDQPERVQIDMVRRRVESYLLGLEENLAGERYAVQYGERQQRDMLREELQEIRQRIRESRSREDVQRVEAQLMRLEVPKGKSYASFYGTNIGKFEPYLHSGVQAGRLVRDVGVGYRAGAGMRGLHLPGVGGEVRRPVRTHTRYFE